MVDSDLTLDWSGAMTAVYTLSKIQTRDKSITK